jgi:hypothetical protein
VCHKKEKKDALLTASNVKTKVTLLPQSLFQIYTMLSCVSVLQSSNLFLSFTFFFYKSLSVVPSMIVIFKSQFLILDIWKNMKDKPPNPISRAHLHLNDGENVIISFTGISGVGNIHNRYVFF